MSRNLASFKSIWRDALGDRVTFAVIAGTGTAPERYAHYTPYTKGNANFGRDYYWYQSRSDIESMIEVVRGSDTWIEITEGEE